MPKPTKPKAKPVQSNSEKFWAGRASRKQEQLKKIVSWNKSGKGKI